jgi:hypothetical protein
MLKKLHLVLAFALLMFASATALGGVTKNKLVGKWSGTATVTMGEASQPFDVEISFGKDGSMTVAQPGDKGQNGYYDVAKSGKTVTMKDGDKKPQAILTVTKFDGKNLVGTVKVTDPNMPDDMKVALSLKKS